MKIYALLMVMLITLAGCSSSYKGTIDGANNQQESKNGNSLVQKATVTNPQVVGIN